MSDSPTGLFNFWEHLPGRTIKTAYSVPLDASGLGKHMAAVTFEDGSSLEFVVTPEYGVRLSGSPSEPWNRMFIPASMEASDDE